MDRLFYKSTRGYSGKVNASAAITKGMAEDGGLFVPEHIPFIGDVINEMQNMNYRQVAAVVTSKFLKDYSAEEVEECAAEAYNEKFDDDEITPLTKTKDAFFLELYHGPTLAFKDMALSILPYLLKLGMKKQGIDKEIVILTATSGDTGKAALEGFADIEGIKIIVFFPENGVSAIQKRQMVTQRGKNTYVIGINGNFDDAQNGVKKIFTDDEFNSKASEKGYLFSSANSINIGRIIPQIVYYFYAYSRLVKNGEIKYGEKINFVVPTGNFGNILSGYYAKKMGLPVNKLICASNENKVLFDFLNTGNYDRNREFFKTISPSMDILISSNLERLLYEISGKNEVIVKELMTQLSQNGSYDISENMKKKLSGFYGGFADDIETKAAIKKVYDENNYIIDTHSAVAYSVYMDYVRKTGDKTKSVILSTASPYKFTRPVMEAIGTINEDMDDFKLIKELSAINSNFIPKPLKDIENQEILHKTVCSREDMKKAVEDILKI